MSQMVHSLGKIGLLPNSANENRKLAVNIAELIINWEKQSKQKPDEEQQTEPKMAATFSEILANFLIRIVSTSAAPSTEDTSQTSSSSAPNQPAPAPQTSPAQVLPQRALELLKQTLALWPEVFIKMGYFEKLLGAADQAHVISTGLNILNVMMDYPAKKFILDNIHITSCTYLQCEFFKP
jgi:transformation/transcription domain-associated protein